MIQYFAGNYITFLTDNVIMFLLLLIGMIPSLCCYIDSQCYIFYIISFIVAHFLATSTELMSGAKSREWVYQNSGPDNLVRGSPKRLGPQFKVT